MALDLASDVGEHTGVLGGDVEPLRRVVAEVLPTDKAEIVNAEVRDRAAQITIRFVSQMISATRDKAGTVVDGNPEKLTDVTDVWTFARDITSRDPNWKLVGTESGQ